MVEDVVDPSRPLEERIRADLAERPDGVLEVIAERHRVPLQAVLDCLPEDQVVRAAGSRFEEVWQELTAWGEVVLIVHTRDGVFETRGAVPPGQSGRGYFNVHGDSPIGGHIRADRCARIYAVDRLFFGKRSCSVQFISVDGDAMFKVFVRRAEDGSLRPEQVFRFEALKSELTRPGARSGARSEMR